MKVSRMTYGLVATLLLGACDTPGASIQGSASVDTIDGVVHVRNSGEGLWTSEERWRVTESLRLGSATEPETELFTNQLLATDIGPDGNIYVLDHFAGRVSVFSPEGGFLRTVGRRGRGPTELGMPSGFTWDRGGRLWVVDPSDRKYVVYDSIGAVVDRLPRATHVTPRRITPLVAVGGHGVVDEAAGDGDLILLRTTLDGARHDTLAVLHRRGGPSDALVRAAVPPPGPEFAKVARHYVPRMKWAVDPEGGVWTGLPDELRFVKLDWSGDTLMVVTADHRASALTSADERLIAEAARQSGLAPSEIDPRRPLFQSLAVLDSGHLLVQLVSEPGEPASVFDVYDPAGRYLGELDVGFPFDPLGSLGGRGNRLVGPMLGEFDVPYVVVVEIDRGPLGPADAPR
jgi:hypothetical protein